MTAARQESPSGRIDKWLWCIRRFKTRSLATRFVSEGGVRVTRDGVTQRIDKPGFELREADTVSFLLGDRLIVLTVTGFAERRGPPGEAKRLYIETPERRGLRDGPITLDKKRLGPRNHP